jgi:hypothetical protein
VTRRATEAIGRTPHENFTAALDAWIERCFGEDEEEEDMTQKHTAGPLAICGLDPHVLLIEPTEGRIRFIAKLPRETGDAAIEQVANAEHLVACWNGCEQAGIVNPEAVPEIVKALEDLFADINNTPESLAIWEAGHPHISAAHAALAKAKE